MSALDLDAEVRGWRTKLVRCAARLLDATYGEDVPRDVANAWRETAADAADAEKALITRLRAAEARTAWQPIETAPRDGTLVLAWHPHWGGPDAVRCSSRGQWTADWLPTCAPTHWQPLPAAPEASHA